MKPRFFPYLFCLLFSPITPFIQQLCGQPIEMRAPNEIDGGQFGTSVSSVDDLDGDGFGDIVIGQYYGNHEDTTVYQPGRAYVFSGSTATVYHELVSPNEEIGGAFGASVSGIPDVNGDGLGDIIVGAAYETPEGSPIAAGRAYIFDGSTGTPLHTLTSPNEGEYGLFGYSVSGIPDLNGDGRGDVIVGARKEIKIQIDNFSSRQGRAYVYDGSSGALLYTLTQPGYYYFGESVSGVPDLNGDGFGDFVVSVHSIATVNDAVNVARAFVYSGSNAELVRTLGVTDTGSRLFETVRGISDIDGDGSGDVLVGDRHFRVNGSAVGRAYLFSGGNGDLLRTIYSPDTRLNEFGYSVAGVPDLNGDDVGEIFVGHISEQGYVFDGNTGELLLPPLSPPGDAHSFGRAAAGVPDVNGNGRGNLVVGAPQQDSLSAGRAYLFFSKLPKPETSPELLDFGDWDIVSGESPVQIATLLNSGSGELLMKCPGATLVGPDSSDFTIKNPDDLCENLPAGLGRQAEIVFNPSTVGIKSATIQFHTYDFDKPVLSIPLAATAVWLLPSIEVNPDTLNFGELDLLVGPSEPLSVTIGNSGDIDLVPTCEGGLEIIGPGKDDFIIASSPWDCVTCPCPAAISPGSQGNLELIFEPSTVGPKSATLEIRTNDANNPLVTVPLEGVGTLNERPTQPSVSISPSNPTTTSDLFCLATGSIDPEGATVSYFYQWSKNGSEIPGATQPTVDSSQTAKGDLFQCVATPRDDEFFGPPNEASVTIRNSTPSEPGVLILPENPTPDQGLALRIDEESTDADLDLIVYLIEWYESENGVDWVRRTEISGNRIPYDQGSASVPDLLTQAADFWRVEVTPIEAHTVINVKSRNLKGITPPIEGMAGAFEVFIIPDLDGDGVANANDLLILIRNWHKEKSEMGQSEREMFFDSIDPPDAQVGVRHLLRTFVSSWNQFGASK